MVIFSRPPVFSGQSGRRQVACQRTCSVPKPSTPYAVVLRAQRKADKKADWRYLSLASYILASVAEHGHE
jgi:hypothetical protein